MSAPSRGVVLGATADRDAVAHQLRALGECRARDIAILLECSISSVMTRLEELRRRGRADRDGATWRPV
ncbi:hypothetical protein [Streptomyces sp. GbtcB6]|uniref:hypothetical protein n=1 Tax=Streptomyces sp. GbtcB6 TaxID=2824751 RepID=UPI001C2FE9D4|nr:hypothetical protein [Streptomyces sp. GbtcB6]